VKRTDFWSRERRVNWQPSVRASSFWTRNSNPRFACLSQLL